MPALPHQSLVQVTHATNPMIVGRETIKDNQIQMASVDLVLGDQIHCVRSSTLPKNGQTVENLIDQVRMYKFNLLERESKFLHRGVTYIAPLNEGLNLPKGFSAKFSPKSSIGRIDVLVRVMADRVARFDHVPSEYRGPLWLEITPLSFDILLRKGHSLVQMRIHTEGEQLTNEDILIGQSNTTIVWSKNGSPIPYTELETSGNGIYMHVDLDREVVGFVARDPAMQEIDLANQDLYEPESFWEPIYKPSDGALTLCPDRFYLLATKERIKMPADICGDIAPYDSSAGEFRSHYAGFFDPGFGGSKPESRGTVGVMEVRGREFPFRLRDRQPICRMDLIPLKEPANVLYGEDEKKSHYKGSGASLSKFFRRRNEIWKD